MLCASTYRSWLVTCSRLHSSCRTLPCRRLAEHPCVGMCAQSMRSPLNMAMVAAAVASRSTDMAPMADLGLAGGQQRRFAPQPAYFCFCQHPLCQQQAVDPRTCDLAAGFRRMACHGEAPNAVSYAPLGVAMCWGVAAPSLPDEGGRTRLVGPTGCRWWRSTTGLPCLGVFGSGGGRQARACATAAALAMRT
jgi:hypothetical protein